MVTASVAWFIRTTWNLHKPVTTQTEPYATTGGWL
jgi:hypothetical protein